MKSFLKTFFAGYFGSCFGVVTLSLLPLLILFAVIAGILSEFGNVKKDTTISQRTFLVVDISRGFSDHPTFSAYNRNDTVLSQGRGAYGLLDSLQALELAAHDPDICGVFLTGNACNAGLPTLEELHRSLKGFKQSGKPVFAYLPAPTSADYFLASAANEIWIHPLAEIPLNGLSSAGIYFKDALQKIGIGVQIVKVGKFKSAVEPLIAQTMSEEDRSQREALIRTAWGKMLTTISAERKISREGLAASAKAIGLYDAEIAKREKLADAAKYTDEVIAELSRAGTVDYELNSFRQIDLADYIEVRGIAIVPELNEIPAPSESKQIAVVYAEGEIVDGYGEVDSVGGERLSAMIRELRHNQSVVALVLRVNSPGGSVFASEQIRRELELISKKIPVVVSMGDVAASGGYWISTPAKKIFAEATTVTGSIGVFGAIPNLEQLGTKLGISTAAVTTSPLAELGTLRRPQTPQELSIFQKSIDGIYDKFIRLVAASRKQTREQVARIAEGRVWSGNAALEHNLVDEIGGLGNAIAYARKQADVPNAEIRQYPNAVNPYQELIDIFSAPENVPFAFFNVRAHEGNSPANTLSRNFVELWKKLRALNDPNCLYARLPWEFSETR